jgi:hypothetical protein
MEKNMSKKIQTTWGKIFENSNMILFNEYPNIINELGKYEELDQFYTYNEEEGFVDDVYQWYIVEDEENWLERFCPEIYEDLHYSDTIGHYILAVKHFGTGWDAVPAEIVIKDEDVEGFYDFYKKIYHDDLPDWVKEMVLNEKPKKGEK